MNKEELVKLLIKLPEQQTAEGKWNNVINKLKESDGYKIHNYCTMHNILLYRRNTVHDQECKLIIPETIAEALIKD